MSFKSAAAALALAIASMGAIAPSHAEVIDFNGLAGASLPGGSAFSGVYTYFGGPATIAGYVFTPPPHGLWTAGHTNSWLFCYGSNQHCATNQTDHLLSQHRLSIRREDGQAFNLNGADIGNWFDSTDDFVRGNFSTSPASSWLVEGKRANGASVSTVVTLDNVRNSESESDFNTFSFSGFTDLTSVDIALQSSTPDHWLVLDNLDVSLAAAPVPEPSTLAMLGVAAAVLLARRKRAAA